MTDGYHSMIFVDSDPADIFLTNKPESYRHTFDNWHLVPSSRPVISPPPVKENFQEVPGSNSMLDLTEVLTGYPLYGNREGSQEFWVLNDLDMSGINQKDWSALYSELLAYFHGRRKFMVLEDDPSYYYEGRWKINEWKSDKERSIITLDYNLQPYKREIMSSLGDWLWDPFNFETGIIRDYGTLELTEDEQFEITLTNSDIPITPIINITADEDVTVKVAYTSTYGRIYTFNGTGDNAAPTLQNNQNNKLWDMVIRPENNTLKFLASGGDATISIDFRGGIL